MKTYIFALVGIVVLFSGTGYFLNKDVPPTDQVTIHNEVAERFVTESEAPVDIIDDQALGDSGNEAESVEIEPEESTTEGDNENMSIVPPPVEVTHTAPVVDTPKTELPEPPTITLPETPDAKVVASPSFTPPLCVYNQAYQENYEADTVSNILAQAEGCYVLLDPFDDTTAKNNIPAIKAKNNLVGCYISIGTAEDWRDDFDLLKPYAAKKAWGEWEGEYFFRDTPDGLVALMKKRLDKLAAWGCDYVEYDNMDWGADDAYVEDYDLDVDAAASQAYAEELCSYTHKLGMKCMAKSTNYNSPLFDGVTYESYPDEKNWWDNTELQTTLANGKLGIVVHYDERDCTGVYDWYTTKYGDRLSFICEDRTQRAYEHFTP